MKIWPWQRIVVFIALSWFLVPVGLIFGTVWLFIGGVNYVMTGRVDDPDDTGW